MSDIVCVIGGPDREGDARHGLLQAGRSVMTQYATVVADPPWPSPGCPPHDRRLLGVAGLARLRALALHQPKEPTMAEHPPEYEYRVTYRLSGGRPNGALAASDEEHAARIAGTLRRWKGHEGIAIEREARRPLASRVRA